MELITFSPIALRVSGEFFFPSIYEVVESIAEFARDPQVVCQRHEWLFTHRRALHEPQLYLNDKEVYFFNTISKTIIFMIPTNVSRTHYIGEFLSKIDAQERSFTGAEPRRSPVRAKSPRSEE